jgi:hypothetical protein
LQEDLAILILSAALLKINNRKRHLSAIHTYSIQIFAELNLVRQEYYNTLTHTCLNGSTNRDIQGAEAMMDMLKAVNIPMEPLPSILFRSKSLLPGGNMCVLCNRLSIQRICGHCRPKAPLVATRVFNAQ